MTRTVDVARGITRSGSPVAHLVTEAGQAWSLHFTPESTQISGIGWTTATIDRQGRKPLVRRQSQQARSLTFTHTLATLALSERSFGTTTAALQALLDLADSGQKVRLINASSNVETRGWWYPSVQATIEERSTAQQVKRATLNWTLTEVIDERPKIARMPPPPPPPKKKPVPAKTGQPDYVVRKGDSLWKIAAIKLGNGQRWKEIYALNQKRLNLAAPEMYAGLLTVWIYPNQVLRIPPR